MKLSQQTFARRLVFDSQNATQYTRSADWRAISPYRSFEMKILYLVFAWLTGFFAGALLAHVLHS